MALVSLKTSGDSECSPSMPNPYGWGTSIRLTDEQCEALGITSAPAAGTIFTVSAKAVATEVTQSVEGAGETGEKAGSVDIRLCLQLTDMSLAPDGGKSTAAMLYGDDA